MLNPGHGKYSSLGFQLIKNRNITVVDKLDLVNVDGQAILAFHGILSYNPNCCQNYGCKKDGSNIFENGSVY